MFPFIIRLTETINLDRDRFVYRKSRGYCK